MDHTLIPFGLRESDNEFVDVVEVPNGKACLCICPSCKTPLIARQGQEKEWHFAHASRDVYAETKKECDFSFFVSVRMMARQIALNDLEIITPEFNAQVDAQVDGFERCVEKFKVTDENKVVLSDASVEKTFFGVPVDIKGEISGFDFIVYFTHPGRDTPSELLNIKEGNVGILEISLLGALSLFKGRKMDRVSYTKILHDFIREDVDFKSWIYHPRYSICISEARIRLNEKVKNLQKQISKREKPRAFTKNFSRNEAVNFRPAKLIKTKKRKAEYECMMCHVVSSGLESSGFVCPSCKSHYFLRMIRYLDN